MVELTPERQARVKERFGAALAEEMGYRGAEVIADLGRQLDVALDGPDVRLRFLWCGREVLSSLGEDVTVERVAVDFALDVADDLKEHRGRGERLPWDAQ